MASSELVVYIVLNKTVKMSPGKAIAQACHVIANMAVELAVKEPDIWLKYTDNGIHPKIILGANQEQIEAFRKKCKDGTCYWIRDVGRNQVHVGTLTALAFRPMPKDQAPVELKALKLY